PTRGALDDVVAATARHAAQALNDTEAGPVVDALHRRLANATRPAPLAPLAQLARAQAVEVGTRVRLRPHLRFALRRVGEGVRLRLRDRDVAAPADTVKAFETL